MILTIDPGNIQSAYMLYDEVKKLPVLFDKIKNEELIVKLAELNKQTNILIIEGLACMGMAVGESVFSTAKWIGRFWQQWLNNSKDNIAETIYRREIKMHLCHTMKAKDANIRCVLIDKFPKTGIDTKGNPSSIGCKKFPGPLYSISHDCWSALAIAVTYSERSNDIFLKGALCPSLPEKEEN